MIHILLHFLVPVLVAGLWYRPAWRSAAAVLVATMLVDVDHLLADPIYDPERCSLGFHPLHTAPAIVVYAGMFVLPWVLGKRGGSARSLRWVRGLHLVGLGLLLHMALDGIDCIF